MSWDINNIYSGGVGMTPRALVWHVKLRRYINNAYRDNHFQDLLISLYDKYMYKIHSSGT